MEVVGKIHEIGAVQNVTDTFKKRDLILLVVENPEYPEYVRFEATQDKVELFDKFKVGQMVEVGFNLRGRPYTNKQGITTYFNSLVAWKINPSDATEAPEPVNISDSGDDETLPF